jgi:hypothetical protein
MSITLKGLAYVGLLVLTAIVLAGCASKAELPPQMTDDLSTLRDNLMQGKSQVQTTTSAARDLIQRPQSNVQPQVDRLVQNITALENLATDNRQQFATADERSAAYFAHWDQQLAGMSRSMAESGEQRRAESMRSHEELKRRVEELRAEFRPFMSRMSEVSTYLKTDPTAAGVKSITPQIKDALDRERDIMKKVDEVIKQIDAMRAGK